MKKVYGIDLGTTYSCIAYMDESGKPVVLKNAEGNLTTPSVVHFESEDEVHVGSMAKESAALDPDNVVSFIKRNMGEPGFRLNIHGVEMKPEEISSYILKKVTEDAADSLAMEGKMEEGEKVEDVVITCPAYFGVAEREATKAAGEIAGLNVLDIINEPTAAAISYGSTEGDSEKNVLVYDLGGGTFDITMINIKPGEIRVVCTGGDKNLGGKDWDNRVLMYLDQMYQEETGSTESVLADPETYQELSLSAENAKKLLSAKPKAPIAINYDGERVKVELTREKFDELTQDLLDRTIDLTKDMFQEAEKKGYGLDQVSEILLVGGSSKMPQVMERVKAEFGKDTKMFDPDEAVAKGAVIYASNIQAYNVVLDEVAEKTGKSKEELKEQIDSGEVDLKEEAKNLSIDSGTMRGLPESNMKIVNVTSRSFGLIAYNDDPVPQKVLYNIILKNAELPAEAKETFYASADNQTCAKLQVMEDISPEEEVDPSLGAELGIAEMEMPAGVKKGDPIEVTYHLDESGLLEVFAKELRSGKTVQATFQSKDALSEEEKSSAISRMKSSEVD